MSKPVDVVVVGAGFAGLSAARTLGDLGLSAVVLEARDRVGGRVYTETLEGGPWVDLGGQWLGPTQDRALALVKELGARTFPTWTKGDNLVVVRGKAKRYRGTIPRLPIASLLNVGWAQWRLERMARRVPLDAPWSAARAREWDRTPFSAWLDTNLVTGTARHLLEAGLETVFAANAREMSLLHVLFYIHSGKDLDMLLGTEGAAQATRIEGGMQTIAEGLAKKVDVRLGCPVRRVVQRDGGVTVHHDGGVIESKRAIVAVPPKLAAALAFEPALPSRRAELLGKMPMGAVIKHTAIYERPFWRDRGLSGMVVSDEGPIHVAFDNSAPGGPGILMGFSEADNARALGKLTTEERRRAAVECFVRYYGEDARNPSRYADHVWAEDPWSGGCYGAFMPPGVWTELGPALREPCGLVHWAGTETATVWSGYIDGAISSGERAAAEVASALRRAIRQP
jgi:monoamine oxidase